MARARVLGGLLFLACVTVLVAADADTVFYDSFETSWEGRWIVSESSDYLGKWKHEKSEGHDDYGLLVSEKARKYGIAVDLPKTVDFKDGAVVLQYDLRLQSGLECGGAYLKYLLPQEAGWTPSKFDNSAPYSIMFGPDKCGATNKVHFIFRHKSPKTGEYIEHHLKTPPSPVTDKLSHVYTAVIYPDNTLKILIDGEEKKTADLLSDDFEPAVIPPKTIPDPEDKKPEDWDERAKIPDPEATKPDDWDESAPKEVEDLEAEKPEGWLDDEPDEIDDPEATKPEDWDDEEDGEWEPPKVPNPKCEEAPGCGEWVRPLKKNPAYKGKWSSPLTDNPAYKGIWKPRDIPNPDYFELEKPNLESIAAIGIEIWTMQDGILFDNVLVSHDEEEAKEYREKTWKPKFEAEKEKATEEEEKEKEATTPGAYESFKEKVFELLYKIPEVTFLAPYKEKIIELLGEAEKHQDWTVGGLFGIGAIILAIFYSLLFGGKKKPDQAAIAKKEDTVTADDTADTPEATVTEGTGEIAQEGESRGAQKRKTRRET
ncbi:hypothetical protein R1sor_015853 [Riccia sorocarpa]|uniref:Calnexin n=1 Tax=Riccia sorocarpa TaxID=122646 RepID=A0ABD3HHD3_9MARC